MNLGRCALGTHPKKHIALCSGSVNDTSMYNIYSYSGFGFLKWVQVLTLINLSINLSIHYKIKSIRFEICFLEI